MNEQSKNSNLKLIQSLISEAKEITYENGQRDAVVKRGQMLLRRFFGSETHYIKSLNSIRFSLNIVHNRTTGADYKKAFESGKKQLLNLLNVVEEDLELSNETITNIPSENPISSQNIFIVHGHNIAVQQTVARTIETLGLNSIILNEQANSGRTIIEKFEEHSNVGFAIVLLTDDDQGRAKTEDVLNTRARQNVILELGYFMGKLGRNRVMPLYVEGVELPTDIHGVLYTIIDKHGSWKYQLVKELKAAGYNVDANAIL